MSPILFLSIISGCPLAYRGLLGLPEQLFSSGKGNSLAYYRGLHALSQALTATYPHIGKKKKKKCLKLAVVVFLQSKILL
jgi:hypothetical protein